MNGAVAISANVGEIALLALVSSVSASISVTTLLPNDRATSYSTNTNDRGIVLLCKKS